jgi:hypothetical protein
MYILYKNPIQLDTLQIVRYLHYTKKEIPSCCIERNWPPIITELPAIFDHNTNKFYIGFDKCVEFWSFLHPCYLKMETLSLQEVKEAS